MIKLTVVVHANGRKHVFTGRKAVELRYWASAPHKPLVFTTGAAGDDFMYHPAGLEPKDVTINCIES